MPKHSNVLIAIVDDDNSFRTATEGLMRSLGYETAGFATATEFLEARTGLNPACVISDIHMPGMSGIEMKQKMNDDGCETAVIFVTAKSDASLVKRVSECGGFVLLYKPFSGQALIDAVQSVIGNLLG